MHPQRCPYQGNATALRASRGVHNNTVQDATSRLMMACVRQCNKNKNGLFVSSGLLDFVLGRREGRAVSSKGDNTR